MNNPMFTNPDNELRQWEIECGLTGAYMNQLVNFYDRRYVHPDDAKDNVKEASREFDGMRWRARCDTMYQVFPLIAFIDKLIESDEINEMGETRVKILASRINSALYDSEKSFQIPGGKCTTVPYHDVPIFTQQDRVQIDRLRTIGMEFGMMVNQGMRYNQIRRMSDLMPQAMPHELAGAQQ